MKRAIWAAALVLGACTMPQGSGKQTFDTYCTGCHGTSAKGDGPYAADLPMPPANLTLLAAGNGGVFPRERVIAKIHGYPDKFHASVMPEFGSLMEGETVMVRTETAEVATPRVLAELVAYLETIQSN